jgi:hypothetical protein
MEKHKHLRVGERVKIEGRVIAHFPDDDMPWRIEFDAPLFSMGGARVPDGQPGPKTQYSVNSYLLSHLKD